MTKTVIKLDYCEISYEDTPEMHKRVFDYLIENYYKQHEVFDGETIQQSDDPTIDAPNVLSEIADDIIGFESTYDDEE